jgi:hypothetical protein
LERFTLNLGSFATDFEDFVRDFERLALRMENLRVRFRSSCWRTNRGPAICDSDGLPSCNGWQIAGLTPLAQARQVLQSGAPNHI